MRFLLDTNVFREIGKTEPHPHVAAWLGTVQDVDLTVSALTVRELRKGVERLRGRKPAVAAAIEARVTDILDSFGDRVLPVTREIADLWGQRLAESEKHLDDTGLAATAQAHGLILVTRNLKHVTGRGAALLDPYAAKPKIQRP